MTGYRTSIAKPSFTILVLLAFVLGGVISCGGEEKSRDVVHVEDLRYRRLPGGARILTGILVNEGEETLAVAQIEVSLFDSDNRRISSMFIVVHDIAAGGRRDFREAVDSDLDVQGARVRNIILP